MSAVTAVAVALWLWPSSVHIVAWPRSGPQRLAVFAPLYRLIILLGAVAVGTVALLVRMAPSSWPRIACILAPLNLFWAWTLPFWPWLPDRWPLLVAAAGPLRWVIGGVALGAVVLRAWPQSREWWAGTDAGWPNRRTAFVVSLLLYAGLGLYATATTSLGGDEPHYLVITHSLLTDGDLQIENNHTRGHYRAFYGGELRPDYLRRGTNQQIYSIHAPGLPVLLLPGYAAAGRTGAVLTVGVFGALAALAVFDLAAAIAGAKVAWIVWACVSLTVPFLPHAWSLYPEMAGAAIVAWAMLWAASRAPVPPITWVGRGICLAWLPWLHTKFSILLAALVVVLAWRLRREWKNAAALVCPIALSGAAWLGFFYVVYGTLDPQVPYGSYTAQFLRFGNIPRSVLGLFLDQKFGLIVYAPVYLLVISGLWVGRRDSRWRSLMWAGLLTGMVFVLSSARMYMWWGGSSAPARFLVPLLPLLVPAMTAGVAHATRAAASMWLLAVGASLSVGGAAIAGTHGSWLYSAPHGVARMLELVQGSAPLTAALPSFTEADWQTPLRLLWPWVVAILAASLAGRGVARVAGQAVWVPASQWLVFVLVASALARSFPPAARADAQVRGGVALLERFDPHRLRAFDYARLSRLTPQQWLSRLTVSFDREPGSVPDSQGRLTEALTLPPGEYDATVWFEGSDRPRPGDLQAALGGGDLAARMSGPLGNPATLRIALPVSVPALWIQTTDLTAARAVRRVQVVARDVVPAGARARGRVRAVEGVRGRPGAYVGFADGNAYPERGPFWTRADTPARVWLAPAGAQALLVTIHVGPAPATVTLRVGDRRERLMLARDDTRTLRIPLARTAAVPIEVQSDSFFVPAEVDPNSTDRRQLGCQVGLVLE
ncbi:MAG: hypothetical protein AB7N65_20775 [Vicinamibacterales bacterium]